jgi:hypothetical protein
VTLDFFGIFIFGGSPASTNSANAIFSPKLRIYIFIFVIWVLFTVNGEIKNMSVRTAQINITRPRRFQKNLRSLLYCNAMFLFQNMWSELLIKSLRWVKRCEHEITLKPTARQGGVNHPKLKTYRFFSPRIYPGFFKISISPSMQYSKDSRIYPPPFANNLPFWAVLVLKFSLGG